MITGIPDDRFSAMAMVMDQNKDVYIATIPAGLYKYNHTTKVIGCILKYEVTSSVTQDVGTSQSASTTHSGN